MFTISSKLDALQFLEFYIYENGFAEFYLNFRAFLDKEDRKEMLGNTEKGLRLFCEMLRCYI